MMELASGVCWRGHREHTGTVGRDVICGDDVDRVVRVASVEGDEAVGEDVVEAVRHEAGDDDDELGVGEKGWGWRLQRGRDI